VFVYVGVANGLQIIIDAASVLSDDGERVAFLLIGDRSDRRRLEEEVRRRRVPGVQIRGAVPSDCVPDILAASDVALTSFAPELRGMVRRAGRAIR
jgi:hypothetical protein